MAKVTTIPAEYEYVGETIALDSGLLDALPGKKLYCNASVRIEPDVQPEELDGALDALVVRDLLIAPAALKKAVSQKCNLLETKAISYEGELWLVEDELALATSRFDYLEGKATPVVRGKLKIAPEVEPKILADRLDRVHNFGEISCTPGQMVAIQARLGISEGMLRDSTKTRQKEKDENVIGNAGYLKL